MDIIPRPGKQVKVFLLTKRELKGLCGRKRDKNRVVENSKSNVKGE
jgi:hypothetical protein